MSRFELVRHLRHKAGHLAFNNILYNWSLGGTTPERPILIPGDNWTGCVERGQWLCSGAFAMDGETLELHSDSWEPVGVSGLWLEHMHGFDWLRDLRSCGGDAARRQAGDMIMSWINRYHNWDSFAWRPELVGRRVSNWLALYEFYAASLDHDREHALYESVARQLRHLSRALPAHASGLGLLYGIKALAYGGLAFRGRESWLEQALDLLQDETAKQILADGGHVSRSPSHLIEALQIFIDIRSGLIAGEYPVPEQIEHTIDRMAQAVRFFRYPDKSFGLFNGAQEGDSALIEAILFKSNARGRILRSLPQSGYERATLGRSMIMMDTGATPAYPYDEAAHAAPLGFEFTYGKERMLVSCGTHPLDEEWRELLRGTAAHNSLTIDHRNICDIRSDGHFARRPRITLSHNETANDAVLLEASHDGYMPVNGIIHRRRLYLTTGGHDLRGEESLTCAVGLNKAASIALRFHLHPNVKVSLIQDGREALLRLAGGSGWRFFHSGGALALEDSIYCGDGARPRKTKQLVIYGQMESDYAQIKWALQRESK